MQKLNSLLSRACATSASQLSRIEQLRQDALSGPSLASFLSSKQQDSPAILRDILAQLKAQSVSSTLQDSYGRKHNYLRISLTERCNLRCTYCMPEDGVQLQPQQQLLSTEELLQLVALFAERGVTKLRLTGGEPLVRKDIVSLSRQLKAIPGIETLGITTNGIVLKSRLVGLQEAGVSQINISLDTLCPEKFVTMTRRKGFHQVMKSIHYAIELGYRPKLNCVVMRGWNDMELIDFVTMTQDLPIDVRFIEWMPFDSNRWNDSLFVSYQEMLGTIQASVGRDIIRLQDLPNDTSKGYQLSGAVGQFGFITSMTDHFCGSCNRLRLTADGNLKVCLFGNTELNLRDALRSQEFSSEDIQLLIQAALQQKHFSLGGHKNMYGISKAKNRPMILIGG